MTEDRLCKLFKRMFKCDTVRITRPCDTMFLIIGKKRNAKTAYDGGQWYRDGQPIDFDYNAEMCVAYGLTEKELIANAREFRRLCKLSTKQYLREMVRNKQACFVE